MKILHYIPEHFHSIDMGDDYKSVLRDSVSRLADNEIAENYSDFKQKAEKLKPEIIHIHACWNLSAYRVQHWASTHGKVVVLSLHKKMHRWHVSNNLFLHKLPLLIIYQRKAIKDADAVLSTTSTELRRMEKIGWNPRNTIIKNALLCGTITSDEMARQLCCLYQKVIDSNSFRLMTPADRELENKMLRESLYPQQNNADIQPNLADEMQPNHADDAQLRKILIHSRNEGVLGNIEEGAHHLGIALPAISDSIRENTIDLFPNRLPKNTKPIEREKLIVKSRRKKTALSNIMADEKPTETERQICLMLVNIEQEMRHKTLSRKHLTELFQAIRFTEYDEDMVLRMFKQLRIRKFAARMLQIMKEMYGLEVGFMPISPINDKKTGNIRKQLLHINI
ncbi:MAG: hypothetical protein IJ562_11000 [Prevotella sp.]|nr:hypothetical protein [Prevotella sp.]